MDTAQILLIVVIVILGVLFLLLGIQVYFILRELKKTVGKFNKVLDDTGTISESIAKPLSNISDILSGVKTGLSVLSLFTKKKNKKSTEANEEK